eukprot:XP_001691083.1 predicted protein [Chlamydomonas reinhardtii]
MLPPTGMSGSASFRPPQPVKPSSAAHFIQNSSGTLTVVAGTVSIIGFAHQVSSHLAKLEIAQIKLRADLEVKAVKQCAAAYRVRADAELQAVKQRAAEELQAAQVSAEQAKRLLDTVVHTD